MPLSDKTICTRMIDCPYWPIRRKYYKYLRIWNSLCFKYVKWSLLKWRLYDHFNNPGKCGRVTSSAAAQRMRSIRYSTFISGTRLWVRRAPLHWLVPNKTCLRYAVDSPSSTARSERWSDERRVTGPSAPFFRIPVWLASAFELNFGRSARPLLLS